MTTFDIMLYRNMRDMYLRLIILKFIRPKVTVSEMGGSDRRVSEYIHFLRTMNDDLRGVFGVIMEHYFFFIAL